MHIFLVDIFFSSETRVIKQTIMLDNYEKTTYEHNNIFKKKLKQLNNIIN